VEYGENNNAPFHLPLTPYLPTTYRCKKGKGKDVDLYSAFHAPGTANALTSLKLDGQTAI